MNEKCVVAGSTVARDPSETQPESLNTNLILHYPRANNGMGSIMKCFLASYKTYLSLRSASCWYPNFKSHRFRSENISDSATCDSVANPARVNADEGSAFIP